MSLPFELHVEVKIQKQLIEINTKLNHLVAYQKWERLLWRFTKCFNFEAVGRISDAK